MITVAVLVFDQTSVFELAVPCEVFGIDRSDMGVPNYRFMVCAAEPGPLRTKAGFTIQARFGLADLEQADTVVVPAARFLDEPAPQSVLAVLRNAHERGARIASLCSGAFVLAAAGLLDGRRATTHWMYAAKLAAQFPAVRVDPSVLYVAEGTVMTSAGTAAAIDLCLHMVRLDHGAELANIVARRMVVPPHRDGGQAQYVGAPMPAVPADSRLAATLAWAVANLDHPLTVEELAAYAHLSSRTFARRFRSGTGTTPLRWLQGQRLIAAQRMLEATDLPIEWIAQRSGFGTAANLRLHFGRGLGTSPAAYRRTFECRLQAS